MRTGVKITLAVAIPLFVISLAVCGLCAYVVHYNDTVLPNVSVAGIDISRLTHDEALQAVDIYEYDLRGFNAKVSIAFPDGSVLSITGEDVGLYHDALDAVDAAFSTGRGNGYIDDTYEFVRRLEFVHDFEFLSSIAAEAEDFEINYTFDTELMRSIVAEFTNAFNSDFEGAGPPQVFDDRIVLVKGAGHVQAGVDEVFDMAYKGLLDSLAGGYPVNLTYTLPKSSRDAEDLLAIRQNIMVTPLSAEYDPETKTVSESVVGVDIDLDGAIALLSGADSGMTIMINVEYTQPEVTQEFLENLLFRDLIGECVTQIPGTENRLNNIIIAATAVNGLILEPGEEFSFNRTVGQRTTARGFRSAPAFANGTTVQAIGGGICQVSSTLYSAIMDTSLMVTERYPHGLPVSYIPRGRDATVSWGSLDFKFLNNTDYPLRIDAEVDGRTLTVKVYGTLDTSGPIGA